MKSALWMILDIVFAYDTSLKVPAEDGDEAEDVVTQVLEKWGEQVNKYKTERVPLGIDKSNYQGEVDCNGNAQCKGSDKCLGGWISGVASNDDDTQQRLEGHTGMVQTVDNRWGGSS